LGNVFEMTYFVLSGT